jgi:hypothetical protein
MEDGHKAAISTVSLHCHNLLGCICTLHRLEIKRKSGQLYFSLGQELEVTTSEAGGASGSLNYRPRTTLLLDETNGWLHMMVDDDCPQGEVPPPPGLFGTWWWPGSLRLLKREGLCIQSSADDLANLITWKFPLTVAELTRRAL